MDLEIKLQCEGNTTVPLDDFLDLQGDLKTLSEDDYVKLRNAIVEYGFSFPVFFWEDTEGKKYIIDAHQRVRTLRKMRDEGFIVPPLPADPIFAQNKTEAKKKLLLLNSRYGKMTDSGLADFVNEEGSSFLIDDISDYLTYPELDFSQGEQETGGQQEKEEKTVTCPACNHIFTPK